MTTTIFVYDKLMDPNLLKKIDNDYIDYHGYVMIENIDTDKNISINNQDELNQTMLKGKIVIFNMSLNGVLEKINQIKECISKNKTNILKMKSYDSNKKEYIVYILYSNKESTLHIKP